VKQNTQTDLQEKILGYLRDRAPHPMTAEEIADAVAFDDLAELRRVLAGLETAGQVVRTHHKRYGIPARLNLVVGRLHVQPQGNGFVIPEVPGSQDVFIPAAGMAGAMHEDRVVARINSRPPGRAPEGEIIRVLARANQFVTGTLEEHDHVAYVVPADRRLPHDIFVLPADRGGAEPGDVVTVEVTQWPDAHRSPAGRVVEVVGRQGAPGVDIEIIVRKHRLPVAFPADALAQAEAVPAEVRPEDLADRVDLREKTVITIDGPDAKDLDDAVSLVRTDDGYELGVHIADVGYYVPEGSPLDLEARRRGTSVYLVDRVIPMLPPRLSNGICSLHPGVDRLTMSVFLVFDSAGRRKSYRIAPSVIRSRERMTYDVVAAILSGSDPALAERYEDILPMLHDMRALALVLKARRQRRGSVDFDFPEPKVTLDRLGRPTDVYPYPRNIADEIIEEFMLAANEAVAEHYARRRVPFLYRVHEEPDAGRVEEANEFLGRFGLHIRDPRRAGTGHIEPRAFQVVLRRVAGRPEESVVNMTVLRTMKLARYADQNLGHFALAARYYTHFTSPIRRYPDLFIHRIIRETLQRPRMTKARRAALEALLPEVAASSSDRERVAEEAERDTIRLKQAEYMSTRIGWQAEGVITGVTSFGFFVTLPNTIEGLVRVSNLADDYYHLSEQEHALVGERTGRVFRLGDLVQVEVAKVDVPAGQVEFVLAERQRIPPSRNRNKRQRPRQRGR